MGPRPGDPDAATTPGEARMATRQGQGRRAPAPTDPASARHTDRATAGQHPHHVHVEEPVATMFTDMPEADLEQYTGTSAEPEDFDAYWSRTLAEAREHPTTLDRTPVDTGLEAVEVEDLVFSGWGGHPIRAWFRAPRGATGPLPTVVELIGYNGGRGLPTEKLFWSTAGFAHVVVDSRAQGAGWSAGSTDDPVGSGPSVGGNVTRGILDIDGYYYRRLVTDAVRAVDAARTHPLVDPGRVLLTGHSQGGAMALIAASLLPDTLAVMAREPFLCDLPRGITLTDEPPLADIVRFLRVHPDKEELVLRALSYVDTVNHARRGRVPAWISVALMDAICPPSGIYAAYNQWQGPKQLSVWRYGDHDGGGPHEDVEALAFARSCLG